LGIDVGTVRVGIARSDPEGLLAVPVSTAQRADALAEIVGLVEELGILEVVVGLPVSLSGGHTASTDDASSFARDLAHALEVPVRMIDERLSTVQASASLHASGRIRRNSGELSTRLPLLFFCNMRWIASELRGWSRDIV